MEENYRRYPIGIQNFEQLRNRNCVYVDKTELVYRLANTDSVYFLSRPRRFGKSLLVSTLEAYFQGKKDLFKGLAMERLEKDWNVYPVFHIDFSLTKYTTLFDLQEQLNLFLLRCEKVYGAEKEEKTPAARLQGMIRRAYEQTGLPVVVLIDEYDAPLLDSNSNIPLQQELRNELRKFFSPLKGLGQYLRFLFITGISKFSQLSIFSELNNLKNISMRDDFSALCGITEQELLTQLKPDIERMAEANDKLAYPNNEVRYGFTESLLPSYVHRFPRENTFYVVSFLRDLMKGDLDNKTEKHYQTIFYLLFRLMGQYVESEVKSSVGRADVVVKLQDAVYVFEFKYDGTPEEALAQIDSKQYAIPYRADGRRVVKIGVNFDSSTRTIGGWKIAKAD